MSLTQAEIRQRIAAKLAEVPDWSESGEPYGRLLQAGEGDFHQRFAVRVGSASPLDLRERQRPSVGVAVASVVRVEYGYELRSPPDTHTDEDAASDAGHALLKKAFEVSRSAGLSLRWVSHDEPVLDPAGRWYRGGFVLTAHHRLALE